MIFNAGLLLLWSFFVLFYWHKDLDKLNTFCTTEKKYRSIIKTSCLHTKGKILTMHNLLYVLYYEIIIVAIDAFRIKQHECC